MLCSYFPVLRQCVCCNRPEGHNKVGKTSSFRSGPGPCSYKNIGPSRQPAPLLLSCRKPGRRSRAPSIHLLLLLLSTWAAPRQRTWVEMEGSGWWGQCWESHRLHHDHDPVGGPLLRHQQPPPGRRTGEQRDFSYVTSQKNAGFWNDLQWAYMSVWWKTQKQIRSFFLNKTLMHVLKKYMYILWVLNTKMWKLYTNISPMFNSYKRGSYP